MTFFENARTGKNHWLLYVALIIVGFMISQIPATIYLVAIVAGDFINHNQEAVRATLAGADKILETIPGFAAGMLNFAFWMGATFFLFKWFHDRDRMTLISGERKLRKNYFLWGVLAYGGLTLILPLLDIMIDPDCYTYNAPGSKYFVFLLLAIILTPLQTGCEELIFRSYLMQGFALCTRSKVWALVITSVLFGLLHSANNEIIVYGFWKMMPVYMLIGLSLGFFAILTDGIEFSWGIHFVNNLIGFVLFSNEGGTLSGNALFVFKYGAITPADYIYPVAFTVIIYFVFRKKMGWDIRKAFDNSGLKKTTPPPYVAQVS